MPAALISPCAFLSGEKDVGQRFCNTLLHLLVEGGAAVEVAIGDARRVVQSAIYLVIVKAGEVKACSWNVGLCVPEGRVAGVCA